MKLRGLPPRVARAPLRLPVPADGDAARDRAQPWRAWYRTARWRALRIVVLVRDLWTCRRCGVLLSRGRDRADAAVVDHVNPHRGDASLFWDEANLQALCKACHDGAKQAEERALGGRC